MSNITVNSLLNQFVQAGQTFPTKEENSRWRFIATSEAFGYKNVADFKAAKKDFKDAKKASKQDAKADPFWKGSRNFVKVLGKMTEAFSKSKVGFEDSAQSLESQFTSMNMLSAKVDDEYLSWKTKTNLIKRVLFGSSVKKAVTAFRTAIQAKMQEVNNVKTEILANDAKISKATLSVVNASRETNQTRIKAIVAETKTLEAAKTTLTAQKESLEPQNALTKAVGLNAEEIAAKQAQIADIQKKLDLLAKERLEILAKLKVETRSKKALNSKLNSVTSDPDVVKKMTPKKAVESPVKKEEKPKADESKTPEASKAKEVKKETPDSKVAKSPKKEEKKVAKEVATPPAPVQTPEQKKAELSAKLDALTVAQKADVLVLGNLLMALAESGASEVADTNSDIKARRAQIEKRANEMAALEVSLKG